MFPVGSAIGHVIGDRHVSGTAVNETGVKTFLMAGVKGMFFSVDECRRQGYQGGGIVVIFSGDHQI